MKDIENIQKRLGITRTTAIFTSLIAIGAVILAVYALKQKNEANAQTKLANQRATDLLQQQQQRIALEERINADNEEGFRQKEAAFKNQLAAANEKAIADSQTRRADKNALLVLQQQIETQRLKQIADEQTAKADSSAEEVIKQQALVEKEKSFASEQKQKSDELKQLSYSRTMANESILLLNENRFDSSRIKALQAYQVNKTNNGPAQSNDIYNALNVNWAKSINNENQFGIHKLPVHCITGMPHSNIIFTADESGLLCESEIKNNSLQKIASYDIKEEVRALSVSPDGNELVAITALGNGFVFTISSSGMALRSSFKFQGTGKAVAFNGIGNFILLSSKGIGKYNVANITDKIFLDNEGINAFAIGKSGKIYTASGNQVNIYKYWDDLMRNASTGAFNFDSRVTGVAIDDNEEYMAAGTYNGFIWINDLKTNKNIWNKALHLSSVNDIKFATVSNDKIQLASAGADRTINLIDVKAILQKNINEDIISLKGHTKWIYALYYTPDALWLFSASEDNKVIAWKPTMNDLYQSLNNIK